MMPLTNSKDCNSYLRGIWKYNTLNDQERVYVVFLDNNGKRIDHKMLCKGRFAENFIDPREIVRKALNLKANYVVLAHNHPGGDKNPSERDIDATENLMNILNSLEILMLDHIILTHDDYFSFKDSGYINHSGIPGKSI